MADHYAVSLSSVKPIGIWLWKARIIQIYCDGSSAGFVWCWWHPLAWMLAPLVLMLNILLEGIPETIRGKHLIGFGMCPWFKDNPKRLEWIPHA